MADIKIVSVAVDRYIEEAVGARDAALEAALSASDAAGLPQIAVSACQGRLLEILARSIGARSILEVGTLGGFSTIFLGRAAATANGHVVSLELNPRHADVARANLAAAGLGSVCDVRTGPAIDTLATLGPGDGVPFDFVFIDADKISTVEYFDWALRLTRPGALIIVDNVVREGAVADPASTDPNVRGIQRFFDRVRGDRRLHATAIQTVGAKSHDGFAVVRVLEGLL